MNHQAMAAVSKALIDGHKTAAAIAAATGITYDQARHTLSNMVDRRLATRTVMKLSLVRPRAVYGPTKRLKSLHR